MDIERMHNVIEKLSESVENEFNKGIECINTCEMKEAVDMLKDLSEAMYYRELTTTMQESDTEDVMAMFDRYGDRKHYKQPYYHMTPEMYRDMEEYRDIDRASRGRMYYTEPSTRDYREGKSGVSRKMYMESKELHRTNTPQDKEAKMRDLEKYMKDLSEDVTDMIGDMTPEERSMIKAKMSTLVSKM